MIANVVTRGFGPGATIPYVVTRGYSIFTGVLVTVQVRNVRHRVRDNDVPARLRSANVPYSVRSQEVSAQ